MIAVGATPATAAPNWIIVARSATSTVSVDVNSKRRDGSMVRYWARSDHVNSPHGWKQDLTLVESDCANERSRNLQITVYYNDGKSASTSSPSSWQYVVPESMGAAQLEYACEK